MCTMEVRYKFHNYTLSVTSESEDLYAIIGKISNINIFIRWAPMYSSMGEVLHNQSV